jgi:hypothetical protein
MEALVYDDGKIKEPYQRLKEVCVEKGIILQIEKHDWLPKGGKCNDSWAETWCMWKDGCQRALAVSEKLRDHEELAALSLSRICTPRQNAPYFVEKKSSNYSS